MKKHIPFITVLLLLACIYLYFLNTSVGFGDSLGYLSTAEKGFILNTCANNHFLYLNFLHLLLLITPFINPFYAASLVSVIFSLLSFLFLYRTVKQLVRQEAAALAAATIFALSFVNWRQTEIIEVYTLNNFIFTAMLYHMVMNLSYHIPKRVYIISLLYGISLLIHIQNILLFPFFLLYLYFLKPLKPQQLFIAFALPFVLASPLILIPVLAHTNTVASVFFQNTGFTEISLAFSMHTALKGFVMSLGYFFYNFMLFGIMIIHGVIIIYKKDRKIFWLVLAGVLPFWLFAMRYDVPDNYVFFLQVNILFTIAGAFGLEYWLNKIPKYQWVMVLCLCLLLPAIYFTCRETAPYVPSINKVAENKAYKGGAKYLFWPGMRNNANLLDLSKQIYFSGNKPPNFGEFEWNYNQAVEYLKEKGELN